ncbi:MAG: MBL fold metallo-hydrolase [Candidatus Methanoperedens sp.]|jgi:glyoxylase-like metal-dependent hydrolase (beta-lactamase superfamily II)|nr:MBL fold metallo-hydrolase [Candidatus Methanoperedens sp.]CAG0995695.1 Hydroxyacylglutathione hydrolase GloC [Methanosarcinales archaeon]
MQVIKINNSPYDANAYLVNGTILIDVGMDSSEIIPELEKHIALDDLEMIILTHCHYDHSGGAGGVASATGAKIAVHKNDAPLLGNPDASASRLFGKKAPIIVPDILLAGGERFGELEIIHTPGHTPGGICIYDPISKTLFSGDTVFQDGSFGRTDLYGGNSSQLTGSIRKLTLLDVNIMYPGHGEIVMNNANEQIKLSLLMASQYSN